MYCFLGGVSVIDRQPISSTVVQIQSDAAEKNDAPSTFATLYHQEMAETCRKFSLKGTDSKGNLKPSKMRLSRLGKREDEETQATIEGRLMVIFLLFFSNVNTF